MREFLNRLLRSVVVRYSGFAVLSICAYYLIFAPFLSTPIEYELELSRSQLSQQLDSIHKSLETLDSAYQAIKRRDRAIHTSLLGELPGRTDKTFEQIIAANNRSYSRKSTEELLMALERKSSMLESEVTEGSELIRELESQMHKLGDKFRAIPSIQPIYNPLFDIHFVTSGMKINPFHRTPELHRGVDYGIEEGTRVYATADGIVSQMSSRVTEKGGLTVEIDHKNGYKTQYSNLQKSTVVRWRRVTKGDIIGYSGNSGYSFLPHLHYAVLYKGNYIKPEDFMFGELSMYEYHNFYNTVNVALQAFD